jgi:hypothetical protein
VGEVHKSGKYMLSEMWKTITRKQM